MINTKDFEITDAIFSGGLHLKFLDYSKVLALSDEDFAEFYLARMTEYKTKDGWWSKGKIPYCSECQQPIKGAKDLRRLYGRSLHPDCFRKVYRERVSQETEIVKQYWDRVASLD
jgi:hypothetical protein